MDVPYTLNDTGLFPKLICFLFIQSEASTESREGRAHMSRVFSQSQLSVSSLARRAESPPDSGEFGRFLFT